MAGCSPCWDCSVAPSRRNLHGCLTNWLLSFVWSTHFSFGLSYLEGWKAFNWLLLIASADKWKYIKRGHRICLYFICIKTQFRPVSLSKEVFCISVCTLLGDSSTITKTSRAALNWYISWHGRGLCWHSGTKCTQWTWEVQEALSRTEIGKHLLYSLVMSLTVVDFKSVFPLLHVCLCSSSLFKDVISFLSLICATYSLRKKFVNLQFSLGI